jgi:hypothetical protein
LHFNPVVLNDVFSSEDVQYLRQLLNSKSYAKNWLDPNNDRRVLKFTELDSYFSKKIEPIVQEIFGSTRIKSTYAVYLDYDRPTSKLPAHLDNNACTYTVDYCVSAKTPWGVVVEGEEFVFGPNQALVFTGGHDYHWRNDMPDPENNRVEVIMFHFCLDDHWYFTHGQEYMYDLMDNGLLPEGDSYHLSPAVLGRNPVDSSHG